MPQLKEGDSVRFKKPGDKHISRAVVTEKHETPRSFIITDEAGGEYRRNRLFLIAPWTMRVTSARFVNQRSIISEIFLMCVDILMLSPQRN